MIKLSGVREPRRFGTRPFRTSLGFGSDFDLMILKAIIQMIEYTEK
ncbi:hypothetical protein LEP1GSC193_2217 [Leptospira alstonii serovar Pingchang str. 80-412]|uniref:Uncharacterized protein n=2 Tax=Leptospira alstonii TaxID=28452 RepID=M6CWH9_9LEPT|nr:hypothetical protein LEP1GSC194_0379 [Leptospira alstonii serovar Sichuan str. 79601]EQA79921.1 hypothetical protein LEP1GSC193_2217 [Leptospira alstonii serovar Pingchang str. 80-412]